MMMFQLVCFSRHPIRLITRDWHVIPSVITITHYCIIFNTWPYLDCNKFYYLGLFLIK